MTRIAIVHPTTLVGRELREELARRPAAAHTFELFSDDEEAIGVVTEVAGRAAIVQNLGPGALGGSDLVFVCDDPGTLLANALLPDESAVVVVSTGEAAPGFAPKVAGVQSVPPDGDRRLLSPHPGIVALAHLLQPLAPASPSEAVATLVLPASLHEQAGVDELLDQTRSLLAFDSQPPREVFGGQLAFNLLPESELAERLGHQLEAVLGAAPPVALQTLQGGFFHSLAAGVFVRLRDDPGAEGVGQLLRDNPLIELADDPGRLGPVDAAANERVLLGSVLPDRRFPGGYWLWAVMDNLTRGGALNAVELAEALLPELSDG